MKTIAADEARVHFEELLKDAEGGETVIVTKHGVPVARLGPMGREADDANAALEEIHRFRRERRPTLGEGVTIRDLIEEGRE